MPADEPDSTVTREHDPDATLVRSAAAPSILPSAFGVPGYELLGELGRGGMGVVYQATQTGLNRVVALKMLLAGQYADPSLRARFLLEAESVAALEHPHIVRVFAFGEHNGHPFLAMEFVPGGTLAKRVKERGPLPAAEASELLVKLANAVAHAHSRGVVHRDIKPLNVLLTSEGEPRLTDFGLAKVGRADQHLSVTGQVLGTPAYMAPEQAAGKVREVGTASDVYALGAVLYDLLTGRPPFGGDSVAVTLQKVISEEPPRPRKLNAAIPRDLETVCLKCLEKDPAKRYPTAQALADDLLRYLRNEPLSVRPAGALERGFKWVKRNKVVAGAITAVSLALVVGASVSLGFGLEAQKQAKNANDAAEREKGEAARADQQRDDAVAARNDLARNNAELTEAQKRVNRNLAKALLGTITADNRNQPLTPYEVETFWQLAELRHDEVSWMFLEEATQSLLSCRQLECRAEHALHAAIGLDPVRRDAADKLLFARLQQKRGTAQVVSLAQASAQWGNASPVLATEVADVLVVALATRASAGGRLQYLLQDLPAVVDRLNSDRATKTCAQVVNILVDNIAKSQPDTFRNYLTNCLSALVAKLDPDRAATVADTLITALSKEKAPHVRLSLAKGLSAVAAQLEPAHSIKVCARASDILVATLAGETSFSSERRNLALALAMVTIRLNPARATDILVATLGKEENAATRVRLARGLAEVAAHMDPDCAAQVAGTLVAALGKEADADARLELARSLAKVATRMDPDRTAQVRIRAADALADALGKEVHANARVELARSLAEVVIRMDSDRAAQVCARTADALTDALGKEADAYRLWSLAQTVSVLAARMDPDRAAQVCARTADALTDALGKETDAKARVELARGLAEVAARMAPDRAAQVCAQTADALADALGKEADAYRLWSLAQTVSVLAARMDPDRAAQVCARAADALTDALGKEVSADVLGKNVSADREEEHAAHRAYLAVGLSAVATRLNPDRAARVYAQTATVFVVTLGGGNRNISNSRLFSESLSAVTFGLPTSARERSQHVAAFATGTFAAQHNLLPSLPLLHPHFHSQPRPLPPQALVELLKHPFCIREARRAVLDALAFTYDRPFKDQWEFVEYAQKHQPQFDLLTPPTRPEPQPSLTHRYAAFVAFAFGWCFQRRWSQKYCSGCSRICFSSAAV